MSKDFYDDFTEDQKLEIQFGIEQLDRENPLPGKIFKINDLKNGVENSYV